MLLYDNMHIVSNDIDFNDEVTHLVLSQFESKSQFRERSGSVVECLTRDRGFKPHPCHCVVVLEQDTFILA